MESLAQHMVGLYCLFVDTVTAKNVCPGYEAFAKQLISRAENIRREGNQKRKRALSLVDGAPSPKRLRLTDKYDMSNLRGTISHQGAPSGE